MGSIIENAIHYSHRLKWPRPGALQDAKGKLQNDNMFSEIFLTHSVSIWSVLAEFNVEM